MLKDYLGPSVSSLAFLFTLLTFWWNNWRLGNLRADTPSSFSASQKDGVFSVVLPLALTNTGARTIAVTAVRMALQDTEDGHTCLMSHRRNHDQLSPAGASAQLAGNFVLEGRGSTVLYAEFTAEKEVHTSSRPQATVEALLSGEDHWTEVGRFELCLPLKSDKGIDSRFRSFSNLAALPSD